MYVTFCEDLQLICIMGWALFCYNKLYLEARGVGMVLWLISAWHETKQRYSSILAHPIKKSLSLQLHFYVWAAASLSKCGVQMWTCPFLQSAIRHITLWGNSRNLLISAHTMWWASGQDVSIMYMCAQQWEKINECTQFL